MKTTLVLAILTILTSNVMPDKDKQMGGWDVAVMPDKDKWLGGWDIALTPDKGSWGNDWGTQG